MGRRSGTAFFRHGSPDAQLRRKELESNHSFYKVIIADIDGTAEELANRGYFTGIEEEDTSLSFDRAQEKAFSLV